MPQVTKPYIFQNQTTADANQVNQDFDTLYNLDNGNLDNTNIKAGGIATSNLATEAVTPAKTEGIPYANDVYGSTGFVLSGLSVTKDGTNANQVDVAAGVVYLLQSDGSTMRRYSIAATNFKTTQATSTFYLDLNPDGTWSWGLSHSAQPNYITIATVTSDASSNVNVITDTRPFGGVQAATGIRIGSTTYAGSQSATANTTAVRDANGNVASQYPLAVMQNPNLLFNPSWRIGLNGWAINNSLPVTATFGVNGEGSFLSLSTAVNNIASPMSINSQNIPISANVACTLSGEISLTGLSAGTVQLQVNAYTSSGSFLTQGSLTISANNGGWTKYSLNFTTPATTDHVIVYINLTAGTTISQNGLGIRKLKLEAGSIVTTFSDDNSFNTTQYGSVMPYAPSFASGTFAPAGGSLNVAAGTVINLLTLPGGTFNSYHVLDKTPNYGMVIGSSFSSGNEWSVITPSAYPTAGFTDSLSGAASGNGFLMYDGSYAATVYFQVNAGKLQAVTMNTASTNARAASNLKLVVW